MTDATFHTTIQDLRRAESKLSLLHGGNPPSNSNVSRMKASDLQRSTVETDH
jgi:hypothetical protein